MRAPKLAGCPFWIAVLLILPILSFAAPGQRIDMSEVVRPVPHDSGVFSPDPQYDNRDYDADAQLEIYGGKRVVDTPRPLTEFGRRVYDNGTFSQESYIFGRKNPLSHQFVTYGDWRATTAYSGDGTNSRARVATRLTLDIDWKLTATERLHATFTPLDRGNEFTRIEFGGGDGSVDEVIDDFRPDALFFEGDLGSIWSGFSDRYAGWEMPIAVGLMPLVLQNGVWLDDAFTGFAASWVSRHSAGLDISNYDITFFAGLDKVNTPLPDDKGEASDRAANIYGLAIFAEANQGYWELGYGYTDHDDISGQNYHNLTVAFSRRYGGFLSNSVRIIHNFGQEHSGLLGKTADGTLLIVESSLITSKPLTLVPYFNFFVGKDNAHSLARGAAAGGVLRNIGLNFEADALSGFQALDASGHNVYGGAIGLEYLFDLSRQLVVELAAMDVLDKAKSSAVNNRQVAAGVRYQQNLNKAWLYRIDAMHAFNIDDADFGSIRFEIRRKF